MRRRPRGWRRRRDEYEKLQTPNSKFQRNSKLQVPKLDVGCWMLGLLWMLDVGIWNFEEGCLIMNYGPIIFLTAFLAVAASWFGLVLTPHVQLGQMQPTNSVPDQTLYPVSRPGFARDGLDVYRANGCAYCHSQQAQQIGTVFDIAITEAGTNQAAAIQAL